MANKLQAGYASVNITPPFGIPLAGYFLERPMDGVLDELEVCALALSDGENKAVIMACDLLGIRAVDLNPVRQAIAERLNMAVEGVLIACTHTHIPHLRSVKIPPVSCRKNGIFTRICSMQSLWMLLTWRSRT